MTIEVSRSSSHPMISDSKSKLSIFHIQPIPAPIMLNPMSTIRRDLAIASALPGSLNSLRALTIPQYMPKRVITIPKEKKQFWCLIIPEVNNNADHSVAT